MVNSKLRSFYAPRPRGKRPPALRNRTVIKRYPFLSFQYTAGSETDKKLDAIMAYLVIDGRAESARQAVYIAAKSMSKASVLNELAILATNKWYGNRRDGKPSLLRVEAIPNPNEGELSAALQRVKALIAEVSSRDATSITNRLAYEVSIGYVASRVEKYAQQDAQE